VTANGQKQLFVHVEEPSMEAALAALLPPLIGDRPVAFKIIQHGSKSELLKNLPTRLRGYARGQDQSLRILVLVDRDDDDCRELKRQLEAAAQGAGLATKSTPDPVGAFRVVNRIVVEELEAWFFGDVAAVCAAYDRVPPTLASRQGFRDPDAVVGGTWEALHRILRRAGHYDRVETLPKIEVARRIASKMDPARNRSKSFGAFVSGLDALLA
jgi:hypothetical protein